MKFSQILLLLLAICFVISSCGDIKVKQPENSQKEKNTPPTEKANPKEFPLKDSLLRFEKTTPNNPIQKKKSKAQDTLKPIRVRP